MTSFYRGGGNSSSPLKSPWSRNQEREAGPPGRRALALAGVHWAQGPPSHPLGEQLQHLPGTLGPPGRQGDGARLVQLPHQRLRLLHRQLAGTAPEPLQVGQQGGEVLVRDLEGAGMSSGPAGGAWRHRASRLPDIPGTGSPYAPGAGRRQPSEMPLTVGRLFLETELS